MKFPHILCLLIWGMVSAGNAFAIEKDLVSFFEAEIPSEAWSSEIPPLGEKEWKPKKVKGFYDYGMVFLGEVARVDSSANMVRAWVEDPSLLPAGGGVLFEMLSRDMKAKLGQGDLITEIPNNGDVPEVRSQAMLWFKGNDVVVLLLQRYPQRANLKVFRQSRVSWQNHMGADEGVFWRQTFKELEEGRYQRKPVEVPKDEEGVAQMGEMLVRRKQAKTQEESVRVVREAMAGLSDAEKTRWIVNRMVAYPGLHPFIIEIAMDLLESDRELIRDSTELRRMLVREEDPRRFYILAMMSEYFTRRDGDDFVAEKARVLFRDGAVARSKGEIKAAYFHDVSLFAYCSIKGELQLHHGNFPDRDNDDYMTSDQVKAQIMVRWLKVHWPRCQNLAIPGKPGPNSAQKE